MTDEEIISDYLEKVHICFKDLERRSKSRNWQSAGHMDYVCFDRARFHLIHGRPEALKKANKQLEAEISHTPNGKVLLKWLASNGRVVP